MLQGQQNWTRIRLFGLEFGIKINLRNRLPREQRSLYRIMAPTEPSPARTPCGSVSTKSWPTHPHSRCRSRDRIWGKVWDLGPGTWTSCLIFFLSQMFILFSCLFIPILLLLSVSRYGWKEDADGRLRGKKGNKTIKIYILENSKKYWDLIKVKHTHTETQ